MDRDLDLPEVYRRILRRWPRISLAVVAGGLLGLITSFARAPLYQSSSVIEVGVDANRTAPIRDLMMEQAYDRVRGLILADETLRAAIRQAGLESRFDVSQMRSRIRLARRLGGWELLVEGEVPAETAALANAWAEVAIGRMYEAMIHAVRAAEWQWALYRAACVLEPNESSPSTAVWVCRSAEGEVDPESAAAALLDEASLSHGILPIFAASVAQRADAPVTPILWNRASLVLAGAVAGSVAGLAWAALEPRAMEAREAERPARRRPGRKAGRGGR